MKEFKKGDKFTCDDALFILVEDPIRNNAKVEVLFAENGSIWEVGECIEDFRIWNGGNPCVMVE